MSLYCWLSKQCQYLLDWTEFNANKKVSKSAKIRNRYNQVPHLIQDTNGKVTNLSQEASPFQVGDHTVQIKRCAQRLTNTRHKKDK